MSTFQLALETGDKSQLKGKKDAERKQRDIGIIPFVVSVLSHDFILL